jgi:hypothetical protein
MKVTCSICKNEDHKMCKVKKIGVHINKRRDCDKFVFEEDKVKAEHIIQTIKVPYAEREELKRRYKEELKQHREMEKTMKDAGALDGTTLYTRDTSHPLTGDLSRFTSTAAKE